MPIPDNTNRQLVGPVPNIRPGKAVVFLRPEALALLAQAERFYGRPIYPTGSGSAGRTYEQQLHYWRVFQAGGPVASHPDHGPNPHRRYGAIDIDDPNARTAMLRAGWKATTPSEWWHFEHPDCREWPIVNHPYTTTHDPEEDPMKPKIFQTPTRTIETAPWLDDGHNLIPGKLVVAAERMHAQGMGSADKLKTEAEGDAIIQRARAEHEQWKRNVQGSAVGGAMQGTWTATPA